QFSIVKPTFILIATFAIAVQTACNDDADDASDGSNATLAAGEKSENIDADNIDNATFPKSITITYDDAIAYTSGAIDGVDIYISDADVMVTSIVDGVEYILEGATPNGSFKIYSNYSYKLTLADVSIASSTHFAINSQSEKTCFVYAQCGSRNTLSDGSNYSTENPDGEDQKGCIFSEGQLVFCGTGTIGITGNNKHAICSDDYVAITNGEISITESAGDAIHANDYVSVRGGTLDITTSGGDCIDVENGYFIMHDGQITATTSAAAKKVIKAASNIYINDGALTLKTIGNALYDESEADYSSASCLKSGGGITISGGNILATSTGTGGKGIRCAGDLIINDGVVTVSTTGGQAGTSSSSWGRPGQSSSSGASASPKGVKANGNININGGVLSVGTAGSGGEGIESKATINVSGGYVVSNAYDDGMNAKSAIVVSGGYVYGRSTDNDGIDSNGTIQVQGGVLIGSGASSPEEGIDSDNSSQMSFSGGKIFSIGGLFNNTVTLPSSTKQATILYKNFSQAKGTRYSILDANGNLLFSYVGDRTLNGGFAYSDADMNDGYVYATGGTLSGGTSVGDYATVGGTLVGYTTVKSGTASSNSVTTIK
ncbi:MAG: carbohydrate-binding domain-containing protein, partial [Bacteroidales bacterium]|nr:carbohydrate-binding domain-containing protein [Bacteroidales bacterium]